MNELMKNEGLKIFENDEFGKVRVVVVDEEPWFVGKDVADKLGYENQNRDIVRHIDDEDRMMVDGKTQYRFGIELGQRGGWLINESGLYSLILSSKLESAKRFKKWVTSDILPTIRKTGGYVNDEALFINTYFPDMDDAQKLFFANTLTEIRKKNELIANQQKQILMRDNQIKEKDKQISIKTDVITAMVSDDTPSYTKKTIINRICKQKSKGGYATRYNELYKTFRETYHIDLKLRCENYNESQAKKKDKLSVVAYAEKFGFISDLFKCCVRLYESESVEVYEEIMLAKTLEEN